MTQPRIQLPPPFIGRPFAVADAMRAGIGHRRLAGRDLDAPFRGVRVPAGFTTADLAAAARAFAPRLRTHHAFGGLSAAALWGLPVPSRFQRQRSVHVIVPRGRHAPTGRGVNGASVSRAHWDIVELDGFPVAAPLLTLLTVARQVHPHELAAMVDALRSDSTNYPGLERHDGPLATAESLDRLAERTTRMHGSARLRDAIAFGRDRVESPRETALRWAIVRIGQLPEPEINVPVHENGLFIGTPDDSWPQAKLGVEYEGDEHRTDRRRWQRDITRVERFADSGWRLMRVTGNDLFPDPTAMNRRIARRLREFGVPLGGFAWSERPGTAH